MKKINNIVPVLCVLVLTSCGGNSGGGSGSGNNRTQQMQVTEGTYKAILRPYNFTVAGWIPNGMTDIKIVGDEVEVKSWLDDSSAVVHMQNIHLGTKCPTIANDLNKDGFVDFNETVKVTNKILIPLDSDLNTQSGGANNYPQGNFSYFQKASLGNIMNDLKMQDLDRNDFTAKLSATDGLNLEGKVIIVTGAAANRALPWTVSTVNGQTRELSIPIACGVIERMPDIANN
jgi:hypothetical protein